MGRQLACLLLGLWLMAAPAALGYAGPARTADRVVGPLVAAVACIALAEVVRDLRRLNLVAALWLVSAPWLLGYGAGAAASSVATGVALAALASRRGRITGTYGGGWRALLGR